uniref:Uncharacterized protein n=1 Tax=Cyanothece sp. (strain PCC 7425 / ATCC 29141) TaxID=395961 RepID=B8HUZ6_CYAP4
MWISLSGKESDAFSDVQAKLAKSENVSEAMQAKFKEIAALTDHFCQEHLNE